MSRFKTTSRTDIEIAKVQPFIKQDDRSNLTARERTSHRLAAVAQLETPFSLPNLLNDDDQLLTQTHDVSMRILSLRKRLERYDMVDVFNLVIPKNVKGDTIVDNSLSEANNIFITKNLLENYSTITEQEVRLSCLFFQKFGQEYDVENLEWSKELLESSCELSLRDKTEERITQETFQGGGPLYFWHMMQLITSSSEQAAVTLIDRINTMKISSLPGENVLRAVSLLRSAIIRLRLIKKLPTDARKRILAVFQTTSVVEFNEIFRIIDITSKFSSTTPITIEAILTIAEEQFTEMLESTRWVGLGQDASTFVNQNNTNFNRNNSRNSSGGYRNNNRRNNNTSSDANENNNSNRNNWSNDKYQSPWSTPPQDGKKTKMINGREVRWCHHCQRWNRTHTTKDHRGPKRDSGGRLITPEQPSTNKAEQQSVSDIESTSSAPSTLPTLPSVTGSLASTANTLRRW